MKILIACEESQRVCEEFRKKGHEAYSCDILDHSGTHDEWHIKGDVLPLLNGECSFRTVDGTPHEIAGKWDMIVAFPPCTHLAVSGAAWFEKKREDGRQKEAIEFFYKILEADCERLAVENPINIIGGDYLAKHFPQFPRAPKYTQKIQPYEFGDPVRKATCLWLKGLPNLKPTNIVEYDVKESRPGKTYSGPAWYATDENGKILGWNDPRTALIRSKTYKGIAKAMAEQWG